MCLHKIFSDSIVQENIAKLIINYMTLGSSLYYSGMSIIQNVNYPKAKLIALLEYFAIKCMLY